MADKDDKKADEKEESPEARVMAAERGARKKLIMGLAMGALVGGTAAFFGAMELNKDPDEAAVVEEVVEEEPEEEVSTYFLEIKRLPASLTDDHGNSIGYYFIDVHLTMLTLEDQAYVAERLPYVQEAINKDIAYNGISRKDRPGTIDYDNLPKRLKAAINKMFGRERVSIVTLKKVSPGQ